jgi:hypothetical protein
MRSRSTFIAVLLAGILSFIAADPFHLVFGKYDSNPYTEIANELNQTSTTGVLVFASDVDFYRFPVSNYMRDIFGTRLAVHGEAAAEFGYDEVLAQASLGQASFMQYLKSREVSHLIVPLVNAEAGVVFHRWSSHGTVKVNLNSKSFLLVRKSGGEFPLALYKVNFDEKAVSAKVTSIKLVDLMKAAAKLTAGRVGSGSVLEQTRTQKWVVTQQTKVAALMKKYKIK